MTAPDPQRPGGLFNVPNSLTTLRLGLAFVLFGLIGIRQWLPALAVFAVAAFTDWLDGHLARRMSLQSRLGRVYDPLVDKILILGAFAFLMHARDTGILGDAGWTPWMFVVLLAREFLVTGIRGLLEERGLSFGADRWGKAKMVVQCLAIAWLLALFFRAAAATAYERQLRDLLNWATVALTAFSGLHYIFLARKHLA